MFLGNRQTRRKWKAMRALTWLALVAAVVWVVSGPAQAQNKLPEGDFTVTLLGTGTPPPFLHRFGAATLVQAGGKLLLFDAGRGVTQQLWALRIRLGAVDHLFLTHLHSDHVVGIPDLWLTGWLTSPFGRRPGPFSVFGPPGTSDLMAGLQIAYAWDIKTRLEDQKLPEKSIAVSAHDVEEGVVFEEDGLKVTAIEVDHGELIKTTLGYRIDYDGRSVVISSDTRFSQNLVDQSQGVDLLIHSIAAAKQELLDSAESWRRIIAHHSQPEDTGRVFNLVRPRMAAYTHIVALTNGKIKPVGVPELVERTRAIYDGPLTVGKDLMTFVISADAVEVVEAK